MGFLRQAALGGKTDNLNSPSACLITGKVTKGTGTYYFFLPWKNEIFKQENLFF
jgi:hypothetical protein